MSTMLKQAIIDAEALKEAARQSAEEKIVEHFSKDIKEAINTILEQDEVDPTLPTLGTPPMADPTTIDMETETAPSDPNLGKSIVDQTPYAATTSEKEFVSIDLDKLEESIKQAMGLEEDLEENADVDALEEDLEENADVDTLEEEYELEEGFDFLEEDTDMLEEEEQSLEEMVRDALAEEFLSEESEEGDDTTEDAPKELSSKVFEEQTEIKDEPVLENTESHQLETITQERNLLELMYEEKVDENKELTSKNNKYIKLIQQLKEGVEKVNLSNAKLLYQNRVLNSVSLNERQKDRIVESITNANTVEEAKIIYETLQSAVGASASSQKPKSLNEVVTKRSSAFVPRREDKREDPFMARMKALAGITDK